MTRIRREDTSALPAQARTSDGHTHPLPGWAKAMYVILAASVLLTVTAFYGEARARDRAIIREIDRRTELRDAQQARTNEAVCRVLTIDLAGSRNAADAARELRCP